MANSEAERRLELAPTFGEILRSCQADTRSILRNIENVSYKLNNAITAVDFNTSCISNGLLPQYTFSRKADSQRITPQQRLEYLKKEKEKKLILVEQLTKELSNLHIIWNNQDIPQHFRTTVNSCLDSQVNDHLTQTRRRVAKKLEVLYGGPIETASHNDKFINLSNVSLTPSQTKLLNLGLNCPYLTKPKPFDKRVNLEILLDDIQNLASTGKVSVSPDLQSEIIREANVKRGQYNSAIMTPELRSAAKELRNNKDITIRKADKSSTFVILPTTEYNKKMNDILTDESKFKQITRNPTNNLKTKLNKLIKDHNSSNPDIKFQPLSGDYSLSYAYGNVKIHKPGNPLRPIISQMPSVTYSTAKRLCQLITPYTPNSFSLNSTDEFLDILKSSRPNKIIGSLDVESLFTNVPVDETIQLILKKIYHSEETPLPIPESTLKSLLEICTKKHPFLALMVKCSFKLMVLQWDPHLAHFLQIFTWVLLKKKSSHSTVILSPTYMLVMWMTYLLVSKTKHKLITSLHCLRLTPNLTLLLN